MCDPIVDTFLVETEEFTEKVVYEYSSNKETFAKYPLRHYSQLEVTFDPTTIRSILKKHSLPVSDVTVLVFGGYTGQFAGCLRSIGFNVIFTDPLEEWVTKAKGSGFEAYKYAAEQIPREFLDRSRLAATFECYPPLIGGADHYYTILRFLAMEQGILFAESDRTMAEIKKEAMEKDGVKKLSRLKFDFLPFAKVYSSTERVVKGNRQLKFYCFRCDEGDRRMIKLDCRVMKLLHDTFPTNARIGLDEVATFSEALGLDEADVAHSLKRIFDLYIWGVPLSLRPIVQGLSMFRVYSKSYTFAL